METKDMREYALDVAEVWGEFSPHMKLITVGLAMVFVGASLLFGVAGACLTIGSILVVGSVLHFAATS